MERDLTRFIGHLSGWLPARVHGSIVIQFDSYCRPICFDIVYTRQYYFRFQNTGHPNFHPQNLLVACWNIRQYMREDGDYRLDDIDRQLIHSLMKDARALSPPELAEQVGVSGATIRNRMTRLKNRGIITGYPATIDFERAEGALTKLFLCHTSFGDVNGAVAQLRTIPGVINVRELIGGRMNLHVLAVGQDTSAVRRIGELIEATGVEIEDEFLLQRELNYPFSPYGPSSDEIRLPITDSLSLAGGADIVEITVDHDSPIDGLSLEEATEQGIIHHDTLVIAIERNDSILTPHGETEIMASDLLTILVPNGDREPSIEAFQNSDVREIRSTQDISR